MFYIDELFSMCLIQDGLFIQDGLYRKNITIHNYLTNRKDHYYVPRVKHVFSESAIRYKIPIFFNSMEDIIKSKI